MPITVKVQESSQTCLYIRDYLVLNLIRKQTEKLDIHFCEIYFTLNKWFSEDLDEFISSFPIKAYRETVKFEFGFIDFASQKHDYNGLNIKNV